MVEKDLDEMHAQPFLSIIIATYNAVDCLPGCLSAIVDQTSCDFEILISDGGSTDGTTDVIESYAGYLKYCRTGPDEGLYDAWNRVLPYARGEWVLFLGADDWLAGKDVLDLARRKIIGGKTRAKYFCFPMVFRQEACDTLVYRSTEQVEELLRRGKMGLTFPSTFVHRSLFATFGVFDSKNYKISGDFDFVLRTWRSGIEVVDGPFLTIMRDGGMSNSPNTRSLLEREDSSILFRNGLYFRWLVSSARTVSRRIVMRLKLDWLIRFKRQLNPEIPGSQRLPQRYSADSVTTPQSHFRENPRMPPCK